MVAQQKNAFSTSSAGQNSFCLADFLLKESGIAYGIKGASCLFSSQSLDRVELRLRCQHALKAPIIGDGHNLSGPSFVRAFGFDYLAIGR